MGNRTNRAGRSVLLVSMAISALAVPRPAGADGKQVGVALIAPACPPVTVEYQGSRLGTTADAITMRGGGTGPVPAAVTHPGLDMDGDDQPDAVSADGSTLTIERGDGTVTLTEVPTGSGQPVFTGAVGADLDGDGRDELWASVGTPTGYPGLVTTFVIPGTVTVGTHAYGDEVFTFTGYVIGDVVGDDGLNDALAYGQPLGGPGFPRLRDHLNSFVHAFDAKPYGLDASTTQVAFRADLDNDGLADTVYLNRVDQPGHAPGPQIDFSTVGSVGFPTAPGSPTPTETVPLPSASLVVTSGQTLVEGHAGVLFFVSTQTYRVRASCANPWMRAIFPTLMGRAPSSVDYTGYGPDDDPTAGQRTARLAIIQTSQTARQALVDQRYLDLLGRPADPSGRAYWVAALRARRKTPEKMDANMVGSREFVARFAGGDPAGWAAAAYPRVVGRASDPGGLAYWARQAASVGTERAAARFLASPEARRHRVRAYAERPELLGAPLPQARFDAYVTALGHGFDLFVPWFLASDEVYAHTQRAT